MPGLREASTLQRGERRNFQAQNNNANFVFRGVSGRGSVVHLATFVLHFEWPALCVAGQTPQTPSPVDFASVRLAILPAT